MKLLALIPLLSLFLFQGCLQSPEPEPDESVSETITITDRHSPISLLTTDFYNSAPTQVWKYPTQISDWYLEENATCGFGNVMTGYAIKAYENEINYLELFCRSIDANGQLGANPFPIVSGYSPDPYEECLLPDVEGYVAVGVKLQITDSNINRCRIRRCAWNSSIKKVNTAQCYWDYDGTSLDTDWELDWAVGSMPNSSSYDANQLVMVGFGAENHGNILRQFMGLVGILVP